MIYDVHFHRDRSTRFHPLTLSCLYSRTSHWLTAGLNPCVEGLIILPPSPKYPPSDSVQDGAPKEQEQRGAGK